MDNTIVAKLTNSENCTACFVFQHAYNLTPGKTMQSRPKDHPSGIKTGVRS